MSILVVMIIIIFTVITSEFLHFFSKYVYITWLEPCGQLEIQGKADPAVWFSVNVCPIKATKENLPLPSTHIQLCIATCSCSR